MLKKQSSTIVVLAVVIVITIFQESKCSHIEISKAENLELNRKKVKGTPKKFMSQKYTFGGLDEIIKFQSN